MVIKERSILVRAFTQKKKKIQSTFSLKIHGKKPNKKERDSLPQ
jgi:hypothetical protein